MCGIAAVLARGGNAAPALLERMRGHLASRGPQEHGAWTAPGGRAGLAAAKKASSEDGRLAVALAGRIVNHPELRAGLERRGHACRSGAEAEVLLHLYDEKGEAMLEDLRGAFALAVWDEERRGLFLARDPYGIKPLYVAEGGATFRAASRVKALLAGGGIDTRPEPAGHAGFFLWGHVPEPHTLYRGIRALPAGTSLWIGEGGERRARTFASLPEALAEAEAQAAPDGDARELLREALLEALRHHLDGGAGLFLSAGLDSATLAALATETGGRPRTLTLGFADYRGTPHDEAPLAEALAAHLGTEHRTVWIGREDFRDALDPLLEAMDQPTTDGVNTYFVSRAARQAGLEAALSGLGGDELFGGYPSFTEIPRLVALLGPVPAVATLGRGFRAVAAPVLGRFTSPKYAGLLEYGTDYGGAYLLRRGYFMPWELPAVLGPDLAREGWAELQMRARLAATVEGIRTPRLRVTALESVWYMRNQLLRDTDWAGVAHGLEVRLPLVDWTLLRRLAPLLAARPEIGKDALARSPRRPLPAALLERPKTGFTVPVRDWLLAGRAAPEPERGLRGWARYVYRHFAGKA